MTSKVYLAALDHDSADDVLESKLEMLWKQAGLGSCFEPKDITALKLHVGEPGKDTFVQPRYAAALVKLLRSEGARPFLTDTAVLYKSPRDNGPGHVQVAHDHGFGIDAVGAPFVPADGIRGSDEIEIELSGKHFEKVSIGSAIVQARSMLVLTHATGHLGTGLGGALKNLGMGCCSKKAKLRQHHGQHPRIDADACTGCATCAEWCPSDAIEVQEHAIIDEAACIGCGECIATCLEGAVEFGWGIMGAQLQERIVEHAAAVLEAKQSRVGYVTVVIDVTKDCDCLPGRQEPLVEDIGVLASHDPVAIDQAALDLIDQRAGQSLESMSYPKRNGSLQIQYAEKLGLGRRTYELIELDRP